MESHICKLCFKSFANGRAYAAHMKAHLTATMAPPLPPPTPPETHGGVPSSFSSYSADDDEFREDPKRIFNILVQETESETESTNPSRKRSKKYRKPPLEPSSSVSDTSPEEDLAMSLMMLSRDRWMKPETKSLKGIKRKKKCGKCTKLFRSYRALFSHEKICQLETELDEEQEEHEELKNGGNRRVFKCPFCFKLFGSGQALGGHKRSHVVSSENAAVTVNASVSLKLEISLIDLNLPAPIEEDDYSVVSDA